MPFKGPFVTVHEIFQGLSKARWVTRGKMDFLSSYSAKAVYIGQWLEKCGTQSIGAVYSCKVLWLLMNSTQSTGKRDAVHYAIFARR